MKPWKRLDDGSNVKTISHRVIVTKTFEAPEGQNVEYGTVWPEGQQFVMAVALTEDCRVIVVRMFRAGPEQIMDELPGGAVDAGESLADACRRELNEESGYRAGSLEYLGKLYKDAYMNAVWHCYLVTDCVYDPDVTHEHEIEEQGDTKLISIDELIANAKEGRTTESAGVLLAYDKLKEIAANDKGN